jgi:hypothetical protein
MSISSQALASDKPQAAIILEQESRLLGPVSVIVSPSALKVIEKRSGIVIVSKSPEWKVSEFNTRTKKIFITPFKGYSAAKANGTQTIFAAFEGFNVSDVPLKNCEPGSLFDFPVKKFKAPDSFQMRMMERHRVEKINGSAPANVDYQILNLPTFAPTECNILARTVGCAELNQLPIKLTYTGTDRRLYNWLVTTSAKKIQVSDKDFAIPTDCIAVKNESMVNQTEATADGVMSLFDMGDRR